MADTDTIKTVAADGKTALTTTRLALVTNLEHWIWCYDKGYNLGQAGATLVNDLRLSLVTVKAGTGNVGNV